MKIASVKKKMPSSAKATPKTPAKRLMKPGQSSPISNDRTVPVTAPTANSTANAVDQRPASRSAASSPFRKPHQFAATVIAGKAIPIAARMMWKPRVKAICSRARSRLDATTPISRRGMRRPHDRAGRTGRGGNRLA